MDLQKMYMDKIAFNMINGKGYYQDAYNAADTGSQGRADAEYLANKEKRGLGTQGKLKVHLNKAQGVSDASNGEGGLISDVSHGVGGPLLAYALYKILKG